MNGSSSHAEEGRGGAFQLKRFWLKALPINRRAVGGQDVMPTSHLSVGGTGSQLADYSRQVGWQSRLVANQLAGRAKRAQSASPERERPTLKRKEQQKMWFALTNPSYRPRNQMCRVVSASTPPFHDNQGNYLAADYLIDYFVSTHSCRRVLRWRYQCFGLNCSLDDGVP